MIAGDLGCILPRVPACIVRAGILYVGANATNEVMRRHRAGETFLFYHWTPSWLISQNDFVRVHLPQHDWRQWEDEQSKFPTGPIGTDFAANPPLKLGNSQLMDVHPHLKDFLQLFTLNEQHGKSHDAS